MRHLVLIMMVVMLAGCASGPAPAKTEPVSEAAPPVLPPSRRPKPPQTAPAPPDYLTPALVEFESAALGVRISYPVNFEPPLVVETGQMPNLRLRFATGEIGIYRSDRQPEMTAEALAKENMRANAEASHGRIVSKDLGAQQLGGEEAWAIQHHFASAAGRTDGIRYFVLKGPFAYIVGCATKEGPPVEPWDEVRPICERVLATIQFEL